jgi:hypothetical protein
MNNKIKKILIVAVALVVIAVTIFTSVAMVRFINSKQLGARTDNVWSTYTNGLYSALNVGIGAVASSITGLLVSPTFTGDLDGNYPIGISSVPSFTQSSTGAVGIYVRPTISSATNISDMRGISIDTPSGSASKLTTYYQLVLNSATTTATTTYGVWQGNSGVLNYFNGKVGIGTQTPAAQLDTVGTIRSTGVSTITSGAGGELNYNSGNVSLLGYNRGTSAYLPVIVNGSTVTLSIGGTAKVSVAAGGDTTCAGTLKAAGYKSSDGSDGMTTTTDLTTIGTKTITIKNGLIISIQ